MSSCDQPFSDRASAFWGHHRLFVEQLAGIAGQRQLGLECRNALVGGCEFVGLHTRGTLDDAGVDKGLTFPAEQCGLTDPGLGSHRGHRFTRS